MRTIGASFSGGGFRASAFTFGCLDLLHRMHLGNGTLLENIAFSSSTSGGSLAMALHAVRSHQGVPFPVILAEAAACMKGDALLAKAMRVLEDDAAWAARAGRSRNLINAFAIAYDELVFKGATLGLLADKRHAPPIARYCFNATELNHGLSFRFDHNGDAATIDDVGNGRQHFAPGSAAVAHQLRIADIAASSSCFPIGFEPMVFPHDFERVPAAGLAAALVNERHEPLGPEELPFGVVDGGAVDNQGLRSLQIEADRRVKRQQPAFDLLLICDVSSFYMDRYEVPEPRGAWRGGPRVRHLLALAALSAACIVAALALALWQRAWLAALALLLPAALVVGGGIALWRKLGGGGSTDAWGVMLKRHALPLLRRMRLKTLRYFLVPRLKTLGLLLNSVFMNEIRRQQYRALYEGLEPRIPIISCMVYELASKNTATLARRMREKRAKAEAAGRTQLWDAAVAPLQPSAALRAVADSAAEMPTTLWFDAGNQQKLDHLIACGRFTMCFNLLVHLAEREAERGLHPDEAELRSNLLAEWRQYQTKPH